MARRLFLLCALSVALFHGGAGAMANTVRGCLTTFDAAVDYFPDKTALEDAANFSVEYRRSYKVVTVRNSTKGAAASRYVLVQCGAPRPALAGDLAGAQVVTVPVASLFAFSTTHLSLLVDLDRLDVLTGVSAFGATTSPAVQTRVASGRVVEFANRDLVIDAERVVASMPAVLMATSTDSASLAPIRQAGIPVVANAEWLESTPLARAEWLKYMALFVNEEQRAHALFSAVKMRYQTLQRLTASLAPADRPLVMAGHGTRGIFTIAGGRSYVAAFIRDAGGRYVWADNPSAGIASVDLEAEIRRSADADFWINGGGWKDRAAMLADEPRYAELRAYRQGQVWVYERRVNASGNDYWARSVSHPDLVLGDLIKIFHPRLVPGHSFEWYMQVPAR